MQDQQRLDGEGCQAHAGRVAKAANQHADDDGDEYDNDSGDGTMDEVDGSHLVTGELPAPAAQRPRAAGAAGAALHDERAGEREQVRRAGGERDQAPQAKRHRDDRGGRSRRAARSRDVHEHGKEQQRVGEMDHHDAARQPVLDGERSQRDL